MGGMGLRWEVWNEFVIEETLREVDDIVCSVFTKFNLEE